MKKVVLIVMAITMIGTLGIATANAGWYTCLVNKAGYGGSSALVQLSDTAATPAFTQTWYTLDPTQGKAHLATALTAISNGNAVQVYFPVTGTPPGYSTITSFFLNTQ